MELYLLDFTCVRFGASLEYFNLLVNIGKFVNFLYLIIELWKDTTSTVHAHRRH